MGTSTDVVTAIKKELKSAQMTYAELGRALGMAESSVKRMLTKGDMSLSRVDAICHIPGVAPRIHLLPHPVGRTVKPAANRGVERRAGHLDPRVTK